MTQTQLNFKLTPGGSLLGSLQVPGDKSISHRALMLSAIASGTSTIQGFLKGEDCLATLNAFKEMGVKIQDIGNNNLSIQGVGLHGLKAPQKPLNMGNSGTSMRLLTGILAGQPFRTELTGDASLCTRPMARIIEPLTQMGAHIESHDQKPPLIIQGKYPLEGLTYEIPIASAQVKSCLLLASLYSKQKTSIKEPSISRDHTERMLPAFGCEVISNKGWVSLGKVQNLESTHIHIPGDLSSAAFFLVGALIAPNSNLCLKGVGINPTRDGVLTILKKMGADISIINIRKMQEEPVADIEIKSSKLQGILIDKELVPLAIDEFPAIFIAAACAKGQTILRGAKELRVKESDRIKAMSEGLTTLGIKVQEFEDGLAIEGGQLQGGFINSYGDHRIAMAFAMASLAANQSISVANCANVLTSFPNFVELAQKAGLKIKEEIANV